MSCFHRNWGASLNDFYWKKLWEIPGTKWADRGNDREANFSFMGERAFQQLELPKERMGHPQRAWFTAQSGQEWRAGPGQESPQPPPRSLGSLGLLAPPPPGLRAAQQTARLRVRRQK